MRRLYPILTSFLILIGLTLSTGVQAIKIDSLEAALQKAKPADRAPILNKMARGHIRSNPTLAYSYARKAVFMSNQFGDTTSLADAYNLLGQVYKVRGDLDSADLFFHQALEYRLLKGSPQSIAASYNNLGIVAKNRGDFDKALSWYRKSLDIKQGLGDSAAVARTLNNVGLIYHKQGKYEEALRSTIRSLKIKESYGDKAGMAASLNNTGMIYLDMGRYSRAMKDLNRSLELSVEQKDDRATGTALNNLGLANLELGNLEKAESDFRQSLALRERMGDKNGMAQTLMSMGRLELERNDVTEGLAFLNRSLQLNKEVGAKGATPEIYFYLGEGNLKNSNLQAAIDFLEKSSVGSFDLESFPVQERALKLLAEAYEQAGDFENAYSALQRHNTAKDSVLAREKSRDLAELAMKYEAEKNEELILGLEKENEITRIEGERNSLLLNLSIASLLAVMGLMGLLYRRNRLNALTNNKLTERNNQIQDKNDELKQINDKLQDARVQAEAASVAKSNFISTISHEVRTPLNGILGTAHLLNTTELSGGQKNYVANIAGNGTALLALLNEIIDYSKLEAGKLKLKEESFAIRKVVKEMEQVFAASAKEKGNTLSSRVDDRIPEYLVGDPSRLRQVLISVMTNANKFTEKGNIHLTVDLPADATAFPHVDREFALEFKVTDTGMGIPADKQAMIFQSFQQADSSNSRQHGGIGLGLTISKRLVELMGGKINLTSEEKVGTEVAFTILARKGAAPIMGQSKSRNWNPHRFAKVARRMPLSILVAEDHALNQQLIKGMFSKMGYDVDLAENGQEVLDQLAKKSYDIVFMDIQMPVMDGLEATKRIHQLPGESPVIVALTANATLGESENFRKAGLDDFLSKPFNPSELESVLVKWGEQLQKKPA